MLRWALLGVYVVVTLIPPTLSLWDRDYQFAGVYDLILLGCLAAFLLGGGIRRLSSPIPWWRRWMPIGVTAFGLATLFIGLFAALNELSRGHPILSRVFDDDFFWPSLVAWSVCWAVWLWVRGRRRPRMSLMWRLTGLLLAACAIELAVTIPALIYIYRHHTGRWSGLLALLGVALGVCVLLLPLGTAIALIFLRPRLQREQLEATCGRPPGGGEP
jgi:hypothetical protein